MSVNATRGLAGLLGLSLLAACGGGKHKTPAGVGTGTDDAATLDAATDAGQRKITAPPSTTTPEPDAGHDAGHSTMMTTPPPSGDDDAGIPYCTPRQCRAMSDDCNDGYCDKPSGTCMFHPKPDGTACGSHDLTNCTAPDKCSAGVCVANDSPEGTPCGDQSVECHLDDACDGHGQCVDHGLVAPGTACGDATNNDCNKRDTCDADGACQANFAAQDAPCGDQGKLCFYDDACDGQGQCVDSGPKSPCMLEGTVSAGGAGVSGLQVELVGGASTTTNSLGAYHIAVPTGQALLIHVAASNGYFGQVEARNFATNDAGHLDFVLNADADQTAAAAGVAPPLSVDLNKGVVVARISGNQLSGNQGATVGANSAAPIIANGSGFQYSNTAMGANGGSLFFFNVDVGNTSVTPVNGTGASCSVPSGVSQFAVFAHTVTGVDIACH